MMNARRMFTFFVLAACLGLAGCGLFGKKSSGNVSGTGDSAINTPPPSGNLGDGRAPADFGGTTGLGDNNQVDVNSLSEADRRSLAGVDPNDLGQFTDPNNPLSQRVIYFGFDSDVIQGRFNAILDAHAAYLKRKGGTAKIRLEGHTDERGTREYNIALGERRANSVRQALQFRGVPASVLTTLSYGEERAADPGHGEAAWAKNRRVELIYTR